MVKKRIAYFSGAKATAKANTVSDAHPNAKYIERRILVGDLDETQVKKRITGLGF